MVNLLMIYEREIGRREKNKPDQEGDRQEKARGYHEMDCEEEEKRSNQIRQD